MELIHVEGIFSDIESLVQEIRTYFSDLDSENIESEMYASRIAKELVVRIENFNGVIETTLLTYLDKDARKQISDWEIVDQNRHYDKRIRENISSKIHEVNSFSPKVFPKKYIKIASGVVAAGGLYSAFSTPVSYKTKGNHVGDSEGNAVSGGESGLHLTFSDSIFYLGMFIVVVAAGIFFLVPRVVDKHNKKKTLEQLEAYLRAVEKRYKEQARKIIDEYVSLFNEITPAKKKDG